MSKITLYSLAFTAAIMPAIVFAQVPSAGGSDTSAVAPSISGTDTSANSSAPSISGTDTSGGSAAPSISGSDTSASGSSPSTSGSDTSANGSSPSTSGSDTSAGTPSSPVVTPVTPSGGSSSSSSSGSSSSGGSSVYFLPTTIGTSTVTINSCPLLTSYLKIGQNNNISEVTKLQAFLKESQGLNVTINGKFDVQTENAVRAFQSKYLSQIMGPWGATQPSGYVYITTEKKINQLACNTLLTLSPSELAIINSYKEQAQNNANAAVSGVQVAPSANGVPASSTTPDIGQNGVGASANTAAAANSSGFAKFWNFIKSLF